MSLAPKTIIALCSIAGVFASGCKSTDRSHPFADVAARDADRPPHEQVQSEDAVASGQASRQDPQARKEARKAAEAAAAQQARIIAEPPPPPQPLVTGPRRPAVAATTYPASRIRIDADGGVVREWPETISWRPSGDVLAGPTYYAITEKASRRPEWVSGWLELGGFLLETALLPFNAVKTPPWTPVAYSASTEPNDPGQTTSRTLRDPWRKWRRAKDRSAPQSAEQPRPADTQETLSQ